MKRATIVLTLAAAGVCGSAAAQTPTLTEYVWDTTKTGTRQWQDAANWAPSGFPNDPLQYGNLSRPLGADLNVDIGAGVVTAGVVMGGTSGVRTTDISSSASGLLTFRNNMPSPTADFNGNTIVEGFDFLIWQRNYGATGLSVSNEASRGSGDANIDATVTDVDYNDHWLKQFGAGLPTAQPSAFVHTNGVAGSVNRILSNIRLDNEQLAVAGTNNLTINGNISFNNDQATAFSASASALNVISPLQTLTVTVNGGIAVPNVDRDPNSTAEGNGGAIDFGLNTNIRSLGKLVLNGVISGDGDLLLGHATGGSQPLSTIELNGNNTFSGDMFLAKGNFYLGHDNAFGFDPGPLGDPSDDKLADFRPNIGNEQYGSNFYSTSDTRNIRNKMILGGSMTIKGEHSLELSGKLTQTNNRNFINLLPAGKELKLSGRIAIWEDKENIERRFEIDGTGRTVITGTINNYSPLEDLSQLKREAPEPTAPNRQLVKRGSGVLVVNVAAGTNNHLGPDIVYQGNMHYANEGSLPVSGQIESYGGAVGLDSGVNNATFMARLAPDGSRPNGANIGGLMLAASDTGAALDFTGAMANAANMTVAAPDGTTPAAPFNFTGSIVPANSKYQLGGGTGTIRLGGAQLTGASNKLEVRNGGVVQLHGLNTYGGSTTLLTKYTSSRQEAARLDNPGVATLQYTEVAPVLEVNKLADGGQASSIGNSTSDAANLLIQGSTLRYTGTGDSTNRLFTIGTGGATIESSGGGALNFTSGSPLARDDAEDRLGAIDDATRDPFSLYDFTDTSDIIVGMIVNDPDPGTPGNFSGANAGQANRIGFSALQAGVPAVVVTGISDNGREIGLGPSVAPGAGIVWALPPIYKLTRITFSAVPRTLTLGGTNTGANTLSPVISNSAAGSVVSVAKAGAGTWVLGGNNTYTGTTTVTGGTLIVNGAQTGGGATTVSNGAILGGGGTLPGSLTVTGTGSTVDPGQVGALAGTLNVSGNMSILGGTALFEIGGTGGAQFDQLNATGTLTAGGTLKVALIGGFVPAVNDQFDIMDFTTGSGAFILDLTQAVLPAGRVWNTSQLLTTGTLSVAAGAVAAGSSVPEPGAAVLAMVAAAGLAGRRRRASRQG